MTLREQLQENGTSPESLTCSAPAIAPETFDEEVEYLGEHDGCTIWALAESGFLVEEHSSGEARLVDQSDLATPAPGDWAATVHDFLCEIKAKRSWSNDPQTVAGVLESLPLLYDAMLERNKPK